MNMRDLADPMQKVSAIDLFCGVGGLTCGLEKAGIPVRLGVDIEARCAHALEKNSSAEFLCEDVVKLKSKTLLEYFPDGQLKLLAGCAPCQPFSTYSRAAKQKHGDKAGENRSEDWRLLAHFGRLIREVEPDFVTMENVPPLAAQPVFKEFLDCLEGYWVDWRVIECQKIGLPQTRKRLVLVASRLGPISIPDFSLPRKTVRETIEGLPKIKAGETCKTDPLHRSSRLSNINLERIRHSKPGGSWRDWPDELRAKCHSKSTGATYPSVYGRMLWDAPAPTITTQCFGYGNGRFGHPDQDRAISLREAAMLQGFPRGYSFLPDDADASFSALGRMIGNAVPVTLGEVIGELFKDHVRQFCESRDAHHLQL